MNARQQDFPQQILHKTNRLIRQNQPPIQILEQAAAAAVSYVGEPTTHSALFEHDDRRDTFRHLASSAAGLTVANRIPFYKRQPRNSAVTTSMRAADRETPPAEDGQGQRLLSALDLLLRDNEEVFGVLSLFSPARAAFTEPVTARAKRFAQAANLVLQTVQLYRDSQEARALNEIARAVNSGLELEPIFSTIADQVARLVPHNRASIALPIANDQGQLEVRPLKGQLSDENESGAVVSATGGGIGKAFTSGRPFIAENLAQDLAFSFDRKLLEAGVHSYVCLPLKREQDVIGTLNLGSDKPYAFGEHDLQILKEIGVQLAIALENAQRYTLQQERATEEAARREVLAAAQKTSSLDEMLTTVLREVVKVTNAEAGWFFSTLPNGEIPRLAAHHGISERFARAEANAGAECDACKRAVVEDGGIIFAPIKECQYLPHSVRHDEGLRGHISVPIRHHDRLVGVLNVGTVRDPQTLNNHRSLLETIGREIGGAILNAQLYEQVRQEQRKLSAILNGTTDLVAVLSEEGRVLMLNTSAAAFFQVELQEVVDQPLERLRTEALTSAFEEALGKGEPTVCEVEAGDERVLRVSFSPVLDVGWVLVMQDITSQKELEQLRREWVAAVSHDIKSPLTGALLSLSILEASGPLEPRQQRTVTTIKRSMRQIQTLVTNVLDLARLEAGLSLHREPVDLDEPVSDAVADVEPIALAKGLSIVAAVPPGLPPIPGDQALLRQMLTNLISNAVKYTDHGEVTVHATSQGHNVQLSVTDTGRGIPDSNIPNLFNRFYRVPGTEAQSNGTGLGLSIVKRIVEKHNGEIAVKSEVGVGSTFTVTLPTQSWNDQSHQLSPAGSTVAQRR